MRICKCGCGKLAKSPHLYYKGHQPSKKFIEVKCHYCNKKIKKWMFAKCYSNLKHRYCSRQCAGKGKQNHFISQCSTCGKQVIRKNVYKKRFKRFFCNIKCYEVYRLAHQPFGKKHPNWKLKTIRYCIICHKKLILSPWQKNQKLCSFKCSATFRRKFKGKNHWNWQGGVTPQTNLRCNSLEWKQIRNSIYKRDNWTCQKCGVQYKDKNGKPLAVHHIIPYRISKNDKSKNLITLCNKCHMKIEPKFKSG